ncbi:golvesin C-terminal-like domain-containing protein [Sedimentisphaera salicampi]|uniref:golvesin C-terminal-like domain-containing protein n=1 Tax=Sedimentisphaera salicampi TaxID=1941349 RepID=UPI000B9D196B|nr:LamG-like jellyroll fold domain-containing protein [Sedimentisphaera salicampi]OXU15630.1 O-Glycosyl hydrolase [Sedimentisphaera salicampi]
MPHSFKIFLFAVIALSLLNGNAVLGDEASSANQIVIDTASDKFSQTGFTMLNDPNSWSGSVAVSDGSNPSPSYARYSPNIDGRFDVYLYWRDYEDKDVFAYWNVKHTGGITTHPFIQKENLGWHFMGTYQLDGDSYVELDGTKKQNAEIVADAVKFVPAAQRVFERTAKNTITPVELNIGDEFHFTLRSGQVRRIRLLSTEAHITESPNYSFSAEFDIDGENYRFERIVADQASFYEPWVVGGMRIWLDAVSDIFEDDGGWMVHRTKCRPKRKARIVVNDLNDRICPEEIHWWYPETRDSPDIRDCWYGRNVWIGPQKPTYTHEGLDINMPPETPLYAPIGFDDHYLFDSLEAGDINNRWRGVRHWANGSTWWLQAHHLDEMLMPEHETITKGENYALSGGVYSGNRPHTHFEFRVIEEGQAYYIDPWIFFWQMFKDNPQDEISEEDELVSNGDFEEPHRPDADNLLIDVPNWDSLEAAQKRVKLESKFVETRKSVPGPEGNQVLRLPAGSTTGTIRQIIQHPWSSGEIFRLRFNACLVRWLATATDAAVKASLLQGDGSLLWSSEIPMTYTHSGDTEVGDWLAWQTFEFLIDTDSFSDSNIDEGSSLILQIESLQRDHWVDNVSLSVMNESDIIKSQPNDHIVDWGDGAEFSVSIENLSNPVCQWYFSESGEIDPSTDQPKGTPSINPDFYIENVQLSDEGYYYCQVAHDGGMVYSDVVSLAVKRKVAHWTLDMSQYVSSEYIPGSFDKYIDSSGEDRDAISQGGSLNVDAFVPGANPAKTSEGLDFGQYSDAAALAGSDSPAELSDEITVSLWVKWEGVPGRWTGIISKREGSDWQTSGADWFWTIPPTGDSMSISSAGVGTKNMSYDPPAVGEWTHLAFTADADGGKLYYNGAKVDSEPGFRINKTDAQLVIGGSILQDDGTISGVFNGVMDDLRIYNYAKDEVEIADLCYEVSETPVCSNLQDLDLQFDVAGGGDEGNQPDCKVGLADFAVLASSWFNCGLYPFDFCFSDEPDYYVPNIQTYNCNDLPVAVSSGGEVSNESESWKWYLPQHQYVHADLQAVNDFVEFDVYLPNPGTYSIQVVNRKEPDSGMYQLYISEDGFDYNPVGKNLSFDQGDIITEAMVEKANLGLYTFASQGVKKFKFKVIGKNPDSDDYNFSLVDIVLKEVRPVSVLPSNALSYENSTNSADGYHYQVNSEMSSQILRVPVDITETGNQVVTFRNVNGQDGGQYQLYVDGEPIGGIVDQYSPEESYSMEIMGVLDVVSSGTKIFEFRTIGKNDNSSGYKIGIDDIQLESPDIIVTAGWGINGERTAGWWPTSQFAQNHYGRWYSYSTPGYCRFRWAPLEPCDTIEKFAWKPWGPDFTGFLVPGWYNVYYWLPDGKPDRASNAPYTVYHKGGETTYLVDQRQPGGEWKLLGTHFFEQGRAGRSGYVEISNDADGIVIADSIKFEYALSQDAPPPQTPPLQDAETGTYIVQHNQSKQTVWGLGVEIQPEDLRGSDSNRARGIPSDLTESERQRFYDELLGFGHGFRYMRLPMGLFYTGLDDERKQFEQSWSSQNSEMAEMIEESGIEGFNFEYWSPPPYFKSNNKFIGGSLKQFDEAFLTDFGNSIVDDLQYVQENIAPVKMFSLQNEPSVSGAGYGCCEYTDQQYYDTFRVVAPIIKSSFPEVFIHADSEAGQYGHGSELLRDDPSALQYVDGWSWHWQGKNSDEKIRYAESHFNMDTEGKPVFNSEWQYNLGAGSAWRTVNTAQSIMNWFSFIESPTWFWLHALKPTELLGERFGLGFWRPSSDSDFSKYASIEKGHWQYNWYHWNAIAGFLKYMPWDSVIYNVDEDSVRMDNRILAWKTPDGKLVLAVTNRSPDAPFVFNVDVGVNEVFKGYRYTSQTRNNDGDFIGSSSGEQISCEVPPFSIEFWVQQ